MVVKAFEKEFREHTRSFKLITHPHVHVVNKVDLCFIQIEEVSCVKKTVNIQYACFFIFTRSEPEQICTIKLCNDFLNDNRSCKFRETD